MRTIRSERLMAAAALALALAACQRPDHSHHFEGGALREDRVLFHTRFLATFTAVPLHEPGEYSFPFRGFPTSRAGVLLRTPTRPALAALEALTTRIELSLTDQTGRSRCHGHGSPASGEPFRVVVASNQGEATSLWLSACSGVDVSQCDPCTLGVKISEIDSATPVIDVIPSLEYIEH